MVCACHACKNPSPDTSAGLHRGLLAQGRGAEGLFGAGVRGTAVSRKLPRCRTVTLFLLAYLLALPVIPLFSPSVPGPPGITQLLIQPTFCGTRLGGKVPAQNPLGNAVQAVPWKV